jgi:hypothetical protein
MGDGSVGTRCGLNVVTHAAKRTPVTVLHAISHIQTLLGNGSLM